MNQTILIQQLLVNIKLYFKYYKRLLPQQQQTFKPKAIALKQLYKALENELQSDEPTFIQPNCHPDSIPKIMDKINKKENNEIFHVKKGKLLKYREECTSYLWNCYGIEIIWSGNKYEFELGQKFMQREIKNTIIIYPKTSLQQNDKVGESRFRKIYRRYSRMEAQLYQRQNQGNLDEFFVTEEDLIYIEEMKRLLLEPKGSGSMLDYYENIFNEELKKEYSEIIVEELKKWEEEGVLQKIEEQIKDNTEKKKEREEESPTPDQEPEPKPEHEEAVLQDKGELPLTRLGAGDAHEVAMNDVQQGQTGDCYYLTSAAAIAKQHPELIAGENGLIKDKGDHYEVTLYFRPSRNSLKREPVTIQVSKNTLVDSDNNPIYAKLGDQELWVVVLEKALAQHKGGYDNIEGGTTKDALEILTGRVAQQLDFKSSGKEDTLKKLKELFENKSAITFGTKGSDENPVEIDVNGKQQILLEGHAYSLRAINGDSLLLYNTHGTNHLEIDFDTLKQYFAHITYVEID